MLGYTYEEVEELIGELHHAVYDLKGGQSNPYVSSIDKSIDLLNGLLEEGHIQ
jgi:hypothetical protein